MSYINDIIGTIINNTKIISKNKEKQYHINCECIIHNEKFSMNCSNIKRGLFGCLKCQEENRETNKINYMINLVGTKLDNIDFLSFNSLNNYLECFCNIHKIKFELDFYSLKNNLNRCPKCNNYNYLYKHELYHTWYGIITRITNKNSKDYSYYGERGIDMDPRYDPNYNNQGNKAAFENFIEDLTKLKLYPIPDEMQIDRIDNNKGYWIDNMRLLTIQEQSQNRRTNVLTPELVREIRIKYATGNYTYAELSREYGIGRDNIRYAILRETWANID